MPDIRSIRRHLPLAILLAAFIIWPAIHSAPPTTCPPGLDPTPASIASSVAGSQFVVFDGAQ